MHRQADDNTLILKEIPKVLSPRKKTGKTLRESEERFRRLFQCHSAVKLIIDPKTGAMIDANEAAAHFYGWSIEKLKSMFIQQINTLPPETVMARMKKAQSSRSAKFEFRHRRADGSIRDVEVFSNEIEIAGKNLLYSIIHDITDRHLAEEALQESESRFRAAFMGSPVALAITSLEDGVWIDANQAEQDLYGYTREEMIGKSALTANIWVDQNDRKRLIDAIAQNGETRKQQIRQRCKDGSIFIASISANLLTIKGVRHIMFATEDITERILSEERIKQNLQEKETLLSEVHHRVKNNLAVISGLIGLQINRIQDETAKQLLDICQNRIKSMALVHEKVYQSETFSAVNFSEYINSIAGDLISSYHRGKKKIDIHVSVHDIFLDIDTAIPCGLIINELITNAVKHAFPETIYPEMRIKFQKVENTYTLMVQDNGIGMPDDVDSSSATTLGLTLVRALMRQIKGNMRFDSDAQGTTVTITFTLNDKR